MWLEPILLGLTVAVLLLVLQAKHQRQMRKMKRQLLKLNDELSFTHKQFIKTQGFVDKTIYALLEELESADSKGWEDSARGLRRALEDVRRTRPSSIMPAKLVKAYTLEGRIAVEERYRDSSYPPDSPLVYDKKKIDAFIEQIKKGNLRGPRYGLTNEWLFKALRKYGIGDKEVAILGSNKPWYESLCLTFGARCTTIEYNRIISDYPGLKVMTPSEYDKNPVQFDAALSISSFEHDGLGRFGDPLNPTADLEAMKKTRSMLKPEGILFLAVPVGKDRIYWNAHRVYGRIRLPLLLEGWRVLETLGFKEADLDKEKNSYEPVFILKNEEILDRNLRGVGTKR